MRDRTYNDYANVLRRYVRPTLGGRPLGKLTPLEIQTLYNAMQAKGLSSRTVRFTHCALRSALQQAVKWRLITQNPADLVDLPRKTRQEMQAFSPEQAASFLKAAADNKWGLLFAFALATGMRPGEYLALQWKDLDLQKGTVTVRRALAQSANGGWKFMEPKTARSRRMIPLPQSLVHALHAYRKRQAEAIFAAMPNSTNLDLVFAGENGSPLAIRNLVRRHFKPILEAAGLPSAFRLYDLRHSCATLLLAAGKNPKIVAERLGHANVTMTLDTYSHVLPDMQKAATEKLEAMLFAK